MDKEEKKEKVIIIPSFNLGNIEEQTLDISVLKKGINPFTSKSDSITQKLNACSKLSENAIVYRGLETRDNSKWISLIKKMNHINRFY